MIRTTMLAAFALFTLALGVQAQEPDPPLRVLDGRPEAIVNDLKAEYALLAKSMEAAQLKVQLHQTQLQLVQFLLQEAQAEAQAVATQQRAFQLKVREALGATKDDEIDYETMTVVPRKDGP